MWQKAQRMVLVLGIASAVVVLGAACAQAQTSAAQPISPAERFISMAAVEPKGGVTVDKEPFPAQKLPTGGGYILKEPDKDGRWEVSTYRWDPGTVIVYQGDKVTLEIVGINGAEHPLRIEGYGITDVVKRGQITRISFTADKAGIFQITCAVHHPSMQADLVVLTRP